MTILKAHFIRKSPESFREEMDVPIGWIVLPHDLIDPGSRRRLYGRWVVISNGKTEIFRVLGLNGFAEENGQEPHRMVIDWYGWLKLQNYAISVNGPVELTIRKADLYDMFLACFTHPDVSVKMQFWSSVITFLLGIAIGYLLR